MTDSVAVPLTEAPQPAPDAPERGYERFRPLLVRFFQRRLADTAESEDLAQEVMIRLLRQRSGVEIQHPEAYLFQVAANVLRDQYRRDSARRRDRHESLDESTPVGEAPSEESLYGDREMLTRLMAALEELTPKCRTVFLLHRYDGLSYSEIARRLGVTQSAIEKHMMSAIKHLHRRLDGE